MSVFIHDNSKEFRLEVRGPLNAAVGAELTLIYQTALSSIREIPAILDLRNVESIDDDGQGLVDQLTQQGMVCKFAEPLAEMPCWQTALCSAWTSIWLGSVPAMVPSPCRARVRSR